MSWFTSLFSGSTDGMGTNELPSIYTLSLTCSDFIRADILATYIKILTDAAERTHGLKDAQWSLLWDSCVQSQSADGLITMLADAMLAKGDLYLVYVPSVDVLRRADDSERRQIAEDYKAKGESTVGVFVSFRNYRKTDMLTVYSEMEWCVMSSLYKTVNIAKAVQLKMSDLRSTVSLADSSITFDQAKSIAEALRNGKDILIDAKDEVSNSSPDIEPTKQAIGFLDAKRAWHLGLPLAYISGLQSGGIGATGDADARAIDRGLKLYFASILQPVVEAIFGVDVTYVPEDTRAIDSGLEVLKAFDLVSDTYLSVESKRLIAARAFELDPTAEVVRLEAEAKARGSNTPPLNGAQVASLATFLEQLGSGAVAPESVLRSIMAAFQMSEEDARSIVNPMIKFKANVVPPPALPSTGGGFRG